MTNVSVPISLKLAGEPEQTLIYTEDILGNHHHNTLVEMMMKNDSDLHFNATFVLPEFGEINMNMHFCSVFVCVLIINDVSLVLYEKKRDDGNQNDKLEFVITTLYRLKNINDFVKYLDGEYVSLEAFNYSLKKKEGDRNKRVCFENYLVSNTYTFK